jgi:peptide deformylase
MTTTDADVFVSEFKRWRDVRGLSQNALAEKMSYDRSYISKIESGRERPTVDFARVADDVLQAGGALHRAFRDFERLRSHDRPGRAPAAASDPADVPGLALVVEHDEAHLDLDGTTYTAFQRRRIRNVGAGPITRYLIRISVDRHPGSPERSNQLYRSDPLTWDELQLEAWAGDDEPLTWAVHHDRDAFKELWLVFENEHRHFPLYPGESMWIQHRYRVPSHKWGNWFQRAVRVPTKHLAVRLTFPAEMDPVVWGLETAPTAQPAAFPTAIQRADEDGKRIFAWSTEDPPLHARFRLEWNFRAHPDGDEMQTEEDRKPSEVMRSLGIVQADDPTLHQTAQAFDLPTEAEDARRVVSQLQAIAERVTQVHTFGKGIGLAAPQIGIDRAAAIVRPPDGDPLVLLNPRVIDQSAETTEHYEGCLSFFDVRGMVPRSKAIEVEHQALDGTKRISCYEHGVARLVAHELDHLAGTLYTERMRPGVEPIPVEKYNEGGKNWTT